MSVRPIGYYCHHQGAGHWQRATLLADALDRPVTLIGTETGRSAHQRLALPDDRLDGFDGRDGEAGRPEAFHYAPLRVPAIRERMTRIAAWVAQADPVLMIVDVSVEVALFARLLSVPTLVVRLAGLRTDTPHLEAFRSAEALLAPFPAALDDTGMPEWVRAKTIHAGFLGLPAQAAAAEDGSILVIYGRGGEGGTLSDLVAAARAVPERAWHVLGPVSGEVTPAEAPPANLHLHGWVPEVGPFLGRASLVVGGGGDGVVAAVAARAKRFVCFPESRPFEEQTAKARRLSALGAAVVREAWPTPHCWPEVVRDGLALDPGRIAALASPDAVAVTAARIAALADRLDRHRD
ncbi:glycosyltransferase [Methylobacterium sp. Leaf466]|uniref:glycosyltransferase n=1 Tax=Methylobacterium sp. Leaf466 TaxID=1736386 RepID=UPI000AACE5AF|nr:glycosyltransferase [Methylobacterium sp. Leaf466]